MCIFEVGVGISCNVGEEAVHVFVLGDGLLAEKLQEHLQLLDLAVDGSGPHVNVHTQDHHWNPVHHQRDLEVAVLDGQQHWRQCLDHEVGTQRQVLHCCVCGDVWGLHVCHPLQKGRVETFVVCAQDRVHEAAVGTGHVPQKHIQQRDWADGGCQGLVNQGVILGFQICI